MNCFTFFWIRAEAAGAQNVTIESDFGFGELTLVFVQAKVVFFESLKNTTKILVLVMLVLAFSKYDDVI